MQATVHRFAMDPVTGTVTGSVVTDDGVIIPLAPEVLRHSALRHLRAGQRVTIELNHSEPLVVTTLHLLGVGALPHRPSLP